MNVLQEILVTQETVNDEYVTVVKVYFKNNDYVKSGDAVMDVETSKAVFSIEAERDGYIRYYCEEGDDIDVGKLIIRIFDQVPDKDISEFKEVQAAGRRKVDTADTNTHEPEFSKSAIEYINKNRVDKNLFNGMDMVTLHDVIEITQQAEDSGENEYSVSEVAVESKKIDGILDSDFFVRLQQDAENFALLDSDTKIFQYKQGGAKIGKDVFLGHGSIIIAEQIEIEDGVVLEENCNIRCESVHLGELGFYRSGFECNCRSIRIGKETFVARNVVVGRGGSGEPTAVLTVGDRVFIGERCLLNTCMPITLGNECFIGQNSSVMTHNIGLSYLDGYENAFAPVVIGDRVQIGINCTLYPNSTIGEGSIVASNSYVIGRIPKDKLVMGVPARVVKDARKKVSGEERGRRFFQLMKRFIGLLEARNISVSEEVIQSGTVISFQYSGTVETILFCDHFFDSERMASLPRPLTVVALEGGDFEGKEDVAFFDLINLHVSGKPTPVTEGMREFFRKAGIKLSPWPWRYRGGML